MTPELEQAVKKEAEALNKSSNKLYNDGREDGFLWGASFMYEKFKGADELLDELEDYFDDIADADYQEGYKPNRGMKLLSLIREFKSKLK